MMGLMMAKETAHRKIGDDHAGSMNHGPSAPIHIVSALGHTLRQGPTGAHAPRPSALASLGKNVKGAGLASLGKNVKAQGIEITRINCNYLLTPCVGSGSLDLRQ